MVYCSKCGTENDEDASHCKSCGASMSITRRGRNWEDEIERRAERFGERAEHFGRSMEDDCFGLPGGNSIVGIIFGLAIILVGVSRIMGWSLDLWPFAIIVFGVLMVAGAIYTRSQSRR